MRAAYALHYRLLSTMSSVDIPIDAGDFALVSREVADVMSSLPERQRYLRGLRAWVGFKQVGIPVERSDRAGGASKYSLGDLVGLALDGILAFSVVPLRIATALGLFGLLGGLVFGAYASGRSDRHRSGSSRVHCAGIAADRFWGNRAPHAGSPGRVCGSHL